MNSIDLFCVAILVFLFLLSCCGVIVSYFAIRFLKSVFDRIDTKAK